MTNTSPNFEMIVNRCYGFLSTDHHFELLSIDRNYFRYERRDIELNLYWAKWEYGSFFQVRTDTKVFRPYQSRQFSLYQVFQEIDPNIQENAPNHTGHFDRIEELASWMSWEADVVRTLCAPILTGDFTTLEKIHRSRNRDE